MNKLLDYGRKALFYVRVLSGYEERRIRSYRMQLEQRVLQKPHDMIKYECLLAGTWEFHMNLGLLENYNSHEAQARKAAINKVPEQIILSEVRRMVEEMQALNKKLEETEVAIEEYFKPLDMEAEVLMKMQLQGEENKTEMMMKALQEQAMRQEVEARKSTSIHQTDNIETNQNASETLLKTYIGEEEKTLKDSVHEADKEEKTLKL